MKRYTTIIRFALWGVLICAAAVQSQAGTVSNNPNGGKEQGFRPTGIQQRIELMVPGLTANAPYQELRITTQLGADTTISSADPTAEPAAEGSATIIHQFVTFTGTALGQLMGVGFILSLFWRVFRRIQREERGGREGTATHRMNVIG